MSRFSGYAFAKMSVRFTAAAALTVVTLLAQPQPGDTKEPIAYIGHGAMFDQTGKELAPSLEVLRDAQAWYRTHLVAKLTKSQRAQFDRLERSLTQGLTLDEQSRMIANAHLIDWLITTSKVENGDRMRGKNNLMKIYLRNKLPEKADPGAPRSTEPYRTNQELEKRISASMRGMVVSSKSGGHIETTTPTSGAAYRTLCSTNGVPIPPDMGNAAWVSRGQIPQSELFIVAGLKAEVLTFQSTTPQGMCAALPRFDNANNVQLDGVICLGKVSSKVCFWDNEKNGTAFTFQRGTARAFSDFGGGTELLASSGGICSDCHAGENPYIIHGTVLNGLAVAGLPTFPNAWYDPFVRTGDGGWPQNPGPMNAPPSCTGCHVQGSAGRFPHLSTAMPGYCNSVLAKSIQLTMPPGAPGSLAGTAEMNNLQAWCGAAPSGNPSGRGDPHITTSNAINYDFQGAGEFVYLRDGDGLEIQTRQTPVATASAIGPDAHTGLTSCVSVNTAVAARVGKFRVSYQPDVGQDSRGLVLHVDGKPIKLGSKGLDLGGGGRVINSGVGGGIEIFFPDKTHLIATPNFWSSQNLWYLNLDVVNTPGREGIMGSIMPGSWLSALPDGSSLGPMPASLNQRYVDLNKKFADAWRVKNSTSLFDYAVGTDTKTFTNRDWPPEKPPCTIADSKIQPARPMDPQKAEELCRAVTDKEMNAQCVFDLTMTGEPSFAKTYFNTQQLRAHAK